MHHISRKHRRQMRQRRRTRMFAAVTVTTTLMGVVAATAAALGGVTSQNFGADVAAVASCDTDGVQVAYTHAYDATDGRYEVTHVSVTGINAACNTRAIRVTLRNTGNASLGEATGTVSGGAANNLAVSPNADSSAVTGVAVVIAG